MALSAASERVLNNPDLVGAILGHAEVDPWSFVAYGCVSKVWRGACRADTTLLLGAARTPKFLTKGVLCGLFGLSPWEADTLPRGMRAHRTGLMYMYSGPAIDAALLMIGGMSEWERRLAVRASQAVTRKDGVGVKRQRPWDKQWQPFKAIRV